MGATGYLAAATRELERLRAERKQELFWLALIWLAMPCISIFMVEAVTDMVIALSTVWRVVAATLAVIAVVAAVAVLICITRRRLSMQAVAALVEKARPAAENRIINAIQFSERGTLPASFIEALLSEKVFHLEQVEAKELYSPKYAYWLKRVAPVALVLWLVPFAVSPKGMMTSMMRIMLPLAGISPHSETVIYDVVPGDVSVKRGQGIDISASLSGVVPDNACVEMDVPGVGVSKTEVQVPKDARFEFTTAPLFETVRYRILAGDGATEWYTAKVAPVPGLLRWEAAVAPPPHTRKPNYVLKHDMDVMEVMPHSTMIFAGLATTELAKITILQNGKELAANEPNSKQFSVKANIPGDGPVSINLLSKEEVEATQPVPLTFLRDNPPTIMLVDTPLAAKIEQGKEFPVAFCAKDDFGVSRVGLEFIPPESGGSEQVASAEPEKEFSLEFPGRFVVDTGSFDLRKDDQLRLRLWVEDNSPNPKKVYSALIAVDFISEDAKKDERAEARGKAEEGLGQLIRRQKLNLKDTRQLQDIIASATEELPRPRLEKVATEQGELRDLAIRLLDNRANLGGTGDALANLVNNEMKDAVELFAAVFRAVPAEQGTALAKCADVQNAILAALTGMKEGMQAEQDHQDKADVFAALQNIVKMQRSNLKDSVDLDAGKKVVLSALVHNQDRIAKAILSFSNLCLNQSDMRAADDFGEQLRKAHAMLTEGEIYEAALDAAESLDANDLKPAIETQKTVMKALLQVLDLLNKWRVKNAKDTLEAAMETIHEVKEKLDGIEKKQARITEVTRDMAKRGPLDDDKREKLAEMDREQEEMADEIEKLANDLYQFPDLPVCNELNCKMREVFEDVLQALDSENTPNIEIAVQKEDAILDAIRATKERIEDVEMWLPDVPDFFTWNMESFDTDEFPEIPLVPLPDELEDLVGELLDQDSNIDAESQDTTGNNIVADAEMGWAVMDGPMPSFSAKGKTGNTKPNDNEMTGRSGAGREGQATGELVENHVKGYEGRETHARKSNDKFQQGMVTEDEDSTFKARATGGGKLGGESETVGMFGNAPRRDLHTAAHGRTPQKLRQETEVLYASARLLFLGSGGLGEAARDMRRLEKDPPDIRSIGALRRRILRRLSDTQVEAENGTVLAMPVSSVRQTGGAAVDDADLKKLPDEYKTILTDYYKGLDE